MAHQNKIFTNEEDVSNYFGSRDNIIGDAKRGEPEAQSILGYCYLVGVGLRKNRRKASFWRLRAAQQGNSAAMANLGLMYETGNGVRANLKTAKKWYAKAAKVGEVTAQVNLGVICLESPNGPDDLTVGIELLRQAAKSGAADAIFNLGEAYMHGYGVRKSTKIAKRYFAKAAALGNKGADERLRSLDERDAQTPRKAARKRR